MRQTSTLPRPDALSRLDGGVELVLDPPCTRALSGVEPDEHLLELAGLGHERAFEALVERHRAALLACCRGIAGPTGGQDALQQTLVSAWHALLRGSQVRHARAWLLSIARHAALQVARDERRHAGGLEGSISLDTIAAGRSPEEQHEQSDRARTALAAIAKLPQRERDALVWTSVQGHSGRDAALALGVSEYALRQLVSRARRRARAAFGLLVPPLPLHRLVDLALRATELCTRRAGAIARSHAGACSAQGSSALARLTAVAIAGTVAGVPVAVFELHAAQPTPQTPSASQGSTPAAHPGGTRHRAPARATRALPSPAQPRSSGPASLGDPRRGAEPPRLGTGSVQGAEAASDIVGTVATPARRAWVPAVAPSLATPQSAAAPHVHEVRHGARSVRTLLGGKLSAAQATAQAPRAAATGADLGAQVTSAAGEIAAAGQHAHSVLTDVAQGSRQQLVTVAPLDL